MNTFRMRLEVEYETDDINMLCIRVYQLPEYKRIVIGSQYPDENGSEAVMRVFKEALSELDY